MTLDKRGCPLTKQCACGKTVHRSVRQCTCGLNFHSARLNAEQQARERNVKRRAQKTPLPVLYVHDTHAVTSADPEIARLHRLGLQQPVEYWLAYIQARA